MLELIPQKNNKRLKQLLLLLFIGGGILMLITFLVPNVPFHWCFQLIALGLLTAGVYLLTRYVTKLFIYRIDEQGDLTVTEANTKQKRQITVARVSLGGIRRRTLIRSEAELKAAKKKLRAEGRRYFDYVTDFRPEESILLEISEGGQRFALRLSYDGELYARLIPRREEDSDDE